MPSPVSLNELEALARPRLSEMAYDYFAGGARDELTLRANRAAWDAIWLRPRVLVDVSQRSLATHVLGMPVPAPILIAPMAFMRLAHPDGEVAVARAAGQLGLPMVLSTLATSAIEEVVPQTEAGVCFQLYVYRDRGATRALVERAEAAGCRALVVTADAAVLGTRDRDLRNGFHLPPGLQVRNLVGHGGAELGAQSGESGLQSYVSTWLDPSFSWKDLEWLRSVTSLPIALKGLVRADDARIAADAGIDAIVVSNHGGRQLDGAVPTAIALPEVVQAAGDRVDVLVDGGIRRGTDVLKALSLGARAVLLGRPVLWALAWDGEAGVRRALKLLIEELDQALALVGCPDVRLATPDLVRRTP